MGTQSLWYNVIHAKSWLVGLFATSISVAAQAADKPSGDASFNPADRLAVTNLVASYGPLYDQFKLTEFRALFVEKPIMEFWMGDNKLSEGMDSIMELLQKRQDFFKQAKIQRRHFLTPRFVSQNADTVTGEAYFLLLTNKEGDKPALVTTGVYEFTAVNDGDNWRISRWIAHVDSPLD
jgi:SnoaL-like domain